VSKCPERVVCGVLITCQPGPLLNKQDPRAEFQAVAQCPCESGPLGHRQRSREILELVTDDRQAVDSGEVLAR